MMGDKMRFKMATNNPSKQRHMGEQVQSIDFVMSKRMFHSGQRRQSDKHPLRTKRLNPGHFC